MMCKLLEVRRSGFYDYLHRLSNTDPRQKFIESCKPFIRAVFSGSKGTYGARRMKKALLGEHLNCPEFLGDSITWEPVSSQGLFERSSYVQTLLV